MNKKERGNFLKLIRESKGYTEEQVAKILRLSPKTLTRWESGLEIPDVDMINSLAELYNITVDEILIGLNEYKKEEQFTNGEINLKERTISNLICKNCIAEHNVFFIVSIAIGGMFFLLELIIGFLFNGLASMILITFGLMMVIAVMIIGNYEIKTKYYQDNKITSENFFDLRKEIHRKNVLFADIVFALVTASLLFLLTLLIFGFYEIANTSNTIVYLLFLILIIMCGYLLIRSHFSRYNLTRDYEPLNKKIRIFASISSISAILLILSVNYNEFIFQNDTVIGNAPHTYTIISNFIFWVRTYFINGINIGFTYRIISIVFLCISIFGIILSAIFKQNVLMMVSFIVGMVSPFLVKYDFITSKQTNIKLLFNLNFMGILFSVFFIVSMVIIFINNKKIIKGNLSSLNS